MSNVSSSKDAHGYIVCVYVYAYLSRTYSRCVYTVRVSVSARLRLCPCTWASTRCLGAWGAGGALQGGLGEASGQGSDVVICQRGGREQLVPAADCGRQVQVLQKDLGHSHEALVVHTPVIPPHYYLEERWEYIMHATIRYGYILHILKGPKYLFSLNQLHMSTFYIYFHASIRIQYKS